MLKNAVKLLWEDIKNLRVALVIIVIYLGFMELVLHNGCPFVVLTGFPCPACGLTRAGIHVLKGEWLWACKLNFMIFPIIILALIAIVYRYFLQKSLASLRKYLIVMILVMVVYYIYRMITQFPGNPPMSYYHSNFIAKLVEWVRMW